ncbi:PREDICTED: disks large-associated protein 5 [Elephantulus edwardii]|uniref:disks large-associated protein 5 n=1 Tax=Elephantulus edwardii TaxID=28737 RepID=UPI0003F0D14D|nr:PREDICTED: disks large-associated protein 5 [Elephantulus edwardii]
MSVSHFANRHRKDLSTDMLRTKIACRKSLSQKENRHKEYERNRHFGLKDSNIPVLQNRNLASLDETIKEAVPGKANVKPMSTKTAPGDQRKQMLQKYKEEKQLQKLKEQREKAERGVFKIGLYRPDKPNFLLSVSQPNAMKEEPKTVISSFVRITRSKTKEQMEQNKLLKSASNEPEKKSPNKGKPGKKTEAKPAKGLSFKVDNEENTLGSQTSATNELNSDGTLSKEEHLSKANIAKMKGKNSFAPKNFLFQPLDGLKTYKATSMIPRRANALTSDHTWIPLKAEVIFFTEHVLNKIEATTENSDGHSIKEVPSHKISEDLLSQPQHDVPYFRNILQSETEKLTSCCLEWDQKLELDIPDHAKGLIRVTVGLTRLLIKNKFKHFERLINDCEYKQGVKETTCTDLDGYWDYISFQIDDVKQKLNSLNKLEESGWQQNNNNISKKVVQKKVATTASKPKQEDDARMAARNRLAAVKKAMRERAKQEGCAEAAISVLPHEVDKIVFDAGFFRIESPVKSFSELSLASGRLSQKLKTPKSVVKAVSQSTAKMDHRRQIMPAENLDPLNTTSEHVEKTLLSDIPQNRYFIIEDTQWPRLPDLIEVNHDADKINFDMDCLSDEKMNLPLLVDEGADNINSKKMEDTSKAVDGMEQNFSFIVQDVLMCSPEKLTSSQSNISQEEETKISLCQSESLPTEYHLLDSPRLNCSNSFTQTGRRHQEPARYISFGGNLITFSPLRPLNGEQSEEF